MLRFLLYLFLGPYLIAGIGLLVGGVFWAAIMFIAMLGSAISSVVPGRGESAAMQQIQIPFVEPTPTPEVRRAMRVARGIHGEILPLPPTLPNGQFDLNSGM